MPERTALTPPVRVTMIVTVPPAATLMGTLTQAPWLKSVLNCSKAAVNAVTATLKQSLADLVEQDDHGRPRLTFALPDATALDGLTDVLARLLVRTQSA